MAKAIISYDKDLPEIPDRRPWEKPTSYLVKDSAAPTGWREEKSGRRPSKMLLVHRTISSLCYDGPCFGTAEAALDGQLGIPWSPR